MTEELLARRYRALLAFYPRWYREQRGAELVGTLLDAAGPGQTRPTGRELRALVLEGLRVRAGTAGHRVVGATLVGALRLVVLVALAMWTLGTATRPTGVDPFMGVGVPLLAAVAYGMVPFVLVALGRVRPAVPFVMVGGLAGTALSTMFRGADVVVSYDLPTFSVVALAGLAVLWHHRRGRGRVGAGMLLSATVPPLLMWFPALLPFGWPVAPGHVFLYGQVLPIALLYLGVLAYAAVDPRPALAMAAFLALSVTQVVAILAPAGVSPVAVVGDLLAVLAVAAVVAVVAAGLGLRRQVAVLPAKIEG